MIDSYHRETQGWQGEKVATPTHCMLWGEDSMKCVWPHNPRKCAGYSKFQIDENCQYRPTKSCLAAGPPLPRAILDF